MTTRCRNPIILMVLVFLVNTVGGCYQMLAWTTAQFAPPKKIPAQYKPPKKKRFLVLVDDWHHVLDYEPLKEQLTERLNQQLRKHGIARKTIDYDRLQELIDATENFGDLYITEVGERLGADIVLYVLVDRFSMKDNDLSPLWHGRLEVSVSLVDVNASRLWPTDREGAYPVPEVETPPSENDSPTYGSEVAKMLADRMADRIAKLFYAHRVSAQQPEPRSTNLFGD